MAIADLRPAKVNIRRAHCKLQAEVAHHRADHGALQRAVELAGARNHVQELVAIDDAPQMIDHHQPIAIAIERKSHVRPYARHRQLQQIRQR